MVLRLDHLLLILNQEHIHEQKGVLNPGLDYQGRPVYLINASTGGGLSGSPVFVQTEGKMQFLGVYSAGMASKYSGERVVGMGEVWRARIVDEILKSALDS